MPHLPPLLVSSIVNHDTDAPDLADAFEVALDACKSRLVVRLRGLHLGGEVDTVYLQLQYDCSKLPQAVKGVRVSRYSSRHRHIEAYAEVTRAEFAATSPAGHEALVSERLAVLGTVVQQALAKRSVPGLSHVLQALNDEYREQSSSLYAS